jgi:hypothetical protein
MTQQDYDMTTSGHVTASEEADKGKVPSEQQEPSQRRSWLRAFFGLE